MITFIIGNGFDLNLGMKTRYRDVYDSYVTSPSKSEVIGVFDLSISEVEIIYDRIHVPVGHGMFNFDEIKVENIPQKVLETAQ